MVRPPVTILAGFVLDWIVVTHLRVHSTFAPNSLNMGLQALKSLML